MNGKVRACVALLGCWAFTVWGAASSLAVAQDGPDIVEYQTELAAARQTVGVNLGRVADAQSLDTLDSAVREASAGIAAEATRLDTLRPPLPEAGAHFELITGLAGLARDLQQVNVDVGSRQVCAASSALANIGELGSVATLRGVTDQLAASVGAERWDTILPPPGVPTDRRLPNGQIVVDNRGSRGSLFEVDNGAERDAVVTMAQAGRAIVSVYVGRMDRATVASLPLGGFEVFFTQGTDWDDTLKVFARDCSFSRFDEISEFTRTQYWEFGLAPVIGGNAPSSEVAPEGYPTG